MSDETRADREALTDALHGFTCHGDEPLGRAACLAAADAVLALLPAPHPQGGTEALRSAAETWRDRLLASTTFWVDDLAAHDVARQLTNLLDSEDCPHLAESGDEGPVVDLPGGWPVRWRCDGCDRIRYDDAALADLRALLAAAPAPTDEVAALLLRQRDALVDEIATLHAAIPATTGESLTHTGPCGPACVAAEAMWRAAPVPSEVVEVDLRLHDGGCGYPDECTCAPAPTAAGDPYCICGGGADHDDDCPRADQP